VATSWILFFSYQDDVRSNTHQIYVLVFGLIRIRTLPVRKSMLLGQLMQHCLLF